MIDVDVVPVWYDVYVYIYLCMHACIYSDLSSYLMMIGKHPEYSFFYESELDQVIIFSDTKYKRVYLFAIHVVCAGSRSSS